MIEFMSKSDLKRCPNCNELSAYEVRRGGFVSLECDLCDYYELLERPTITERPQGQTALGGF